MSRLPLPLEAVSHSARTLQFVVSPGGKTMLIDGGGAFGGFAGREASLGSDPGEEAVSPYLWSRGFQKLRSCISDASFLAPEWQMQRQRWRKYQIKTRTPRSNRKPTAACHS